MQSHSCALRANLRYAELKQYPIGYLEVCLDQPQKDLKKSRRLV